MKCPVFLSMVLVAGGVLGITRVAEAALVVTDSAGWDFKYEGDVVDEEPNPLPGYTTLAGHGGHNLSTDGDVLTFETTSDSVVLPDA